MLRIGMLTSGGDCQALNAAMRGVVKGICNKRIDVEIYGFKDGFKGLIYSDFNMLTSKDFSGILTQGGTILGTSRQPFKLMRVPDKDGIDKVEAMKHTYHKLHLDCLVILGGNGTHKTANLLREEGLNVVTLPKTIDNDLWGTDMTFGFQSAVDIATDTIDRLHTKATSHGRVFNIELLGHIVGHVTLQDGIAGGADIILLPEIPYDIKVVAKKVKETLKNEKNYAIIACAEGAISEADALMKRKDYKAKVLARNGRSVAYEVADELRQDIDAEIRVSCIVHAQRGGNPNSYDREISTRFGVEGARLIIKKHYGEYVVLQGNHVSHIPLEATAGKLKYVDTEGEIVQSAKLVGISFGE